MITLPDIGLGSANLLEPPLSEFIEIAARHGFRRIGVRPYVFLETLRQGETEAGLRRRLADAGIEVTMIDALNNGLPGVPSPDILSDEERKLMPPDVLHPVPEADCLRTASALGARLLNVVAYRGDLVSVDQMAEAVSGICRRAATHGVTVALEFLPDSGMPDIIRAQQVREACGEPNCGILLDAYHLDRSGDSVEEIRLLPPGAIPAIQISDRKRSAAGNVPLGGRLMPGEGELPLNALVTAALENSPSATVDLEVLNAELKALPADEAARQLAAASSTWREAFLGSHRR